MAATKVANAIYNALKDVESDDVNAWVEARDAVEHMCKIKFSNITKPLSFKNFINKHVRKMFETCQLVCNCKRVDDKFVTIDYMIIYSEINEQIELQYDFDMVLDKPIKLFNTENIPKTTATVTIFVYDEGLYDIEFE